MNYDTLSHLSLWNAVSDCLRGVFLKTTIDSLRLLGNRISWVAWSDCCFCPEQAQVLLTTLEKSSHFPHSWLDTHTAGSRCRPAAAAATERWMDWVSVKHLQESSNKIIQIIRFYRFQM